MVGDGSPLTLHGSTNSLPAVSVTVLLKLTITGGTAIIHIYISNFEKQVYLARKLLSFLALFAKCKED